MKHDLESRLERALKPARKRKTKARPSKMRLTPEQWSAAHPIGTRVRYWPVLPPRREELGFVTRTRSEAWALRSGHVVVMIEGSTGCVYVTHLDILGDSDG